MLLIVTHHFRFWDGFLEEKGSGSGYHCRGRRYVFDQIILVVCLSEWRLMSGLWR